MEPFFIESISGEVFALYYTPSTDVMKNILFIPPFAEELNRSRHMINRQARAFADSGYAVLILDLYGTGDSEGTFGEATVDIWQQDILAAIRWLERSSDKSPVLWAMRSGALIATDLIQQYPAITDQLILWSPVTSGKKFIQQYLRIKLAADLTKSAPGQQNNITELLTQLDQRSNLEIAGYSLSPDLARGLSTLSLNTVKMPRELSIKWIDISPLEPPLLSPAAQRVTKIWEENGINISAIAVNDVPFWTLQEPEWAMSYISHTLKLILP